MDGKSDVKDKKKTQKLKRYFADDKVSREKDHQTQKDSSSNVLVFTPHLDHISDHKLHDRSERWTKKTKWMNYPPEGKPFNSGHGQQKEFRKKLDPFPGDAPVPQEKIKKYRRGKKLHSTKARNKLESYKLIEKEKKLSLAVVQAARSELLLQEEAGFLEAEEGEDITELTQHDIADVVDITSAQKFFELNLNEFGPYRMNYTRNGRFLLLGGAAGHIASIDWLTKKLLCEINVMETVHDVRWLHQETMFAVAQKQWTYIYDNQGIEIHCLKILDSVLRLEFLPYHFLLASSNSKGYLSYIDVSVGKKVAGISTGLGRLDVMCQNPNNAIICMGHPGGTVTMWSPNVKEPLVKMLCHRAGVRAIAVDHTGKYMVTSSIDRTMKIWDLRTYKMMQSYKLGGGGGHLAFSQRGLIAAGIGNIVEVYNDCINNTMTAPYMMHQLQSTVHGLQFCPYEDVLGVGHGTGFSSLIIPGAGEANYDALEANPYQTKKQRQEAEIKLLLEKIQPEMIHLDAGRIGQMDVKTYLENTEKLQVSKPNKTEFELKYKMKGKSKGLHKEHRKKGVVEKEKMKFIRDKLKEKERVEREKEHSQTPGTKSVLDRFIKSSQ
ncbi:hypothetical protein ACJMK2_039773 [Sinanodonta woodiana]|uniref:WD repeat-containing protein 46 n=1 Tax=Sinanodonta woodiana TaxID=1069815 RepID=A0ABD3WDZ1_SINWO